MQFSTSKGIFLVGCARSGTTLLQSLLAAHPKIISFPESKFFTYLVPESGSKRLALGISSKRLTPMLKKFLSEIEHPELIELLPKTPLFMGRYTNIFTRILNKIAESQDKDMWLEKTPEHLEYIKYIERFIPEAKIIHIIRNGQDVVSSLYSLAKNHPQYWLDEHRFNDIDSCIDWWIKAISISQRYLDRPNHFFVQYEELVSDTPKILAELCQFLKIEFCQEMMENYSDNAEELIRGREIWKTNINREIKSTNSQKFYRLFNAEQQQYILSRISEISLKP